ncbi:uncharacterized protein [Drosophila suzukii]|uniref:Uncharacterized protein n=1 Tax=Drosophila suzukii TaxID=28584 RepID=A0AB39ZBV0_DROSZ
MDTDRRPRLRRSARLRRVLLRRLLAILPVQNYRVIFFLDSRPSAARRIILNGPHPHLHVLSGPSVPNRPRFMRMDLSRPFNVVQSVLLPIARAPSAFPQWIRYTSVSRWDRPFGDVRGVLLMGMIVDSSVETLMRQNPTRAMSLILYIAHYFLY